MNHLYETLASALEYPGEDWNTRLDRCRQWLTIQEPEVAIQLISFRRKVQKLAIEELKELYSQTFVLNPLCSLDIGYHLFGDNDNRVRLLTRLEDEERRHALIIELLIPALGKMLDALNQANNPYQDLIEVISNALKNELPAAASSQIGDAGDGSRDHRISSKAPATEKQVVGS